MAVPRSLRWAFWVAGGLVALIVLAIVGCTLLHPDATTRLGRHFDLDDVSTEQAIEAGLASKVPAGTSEADVGAFLDKSGIGKDGLSSWYPTDKDGVIVCRIEFDTTTLEFVKESYGVLFRLDERRTLESIEVKRWLTGL